MSLTSWVEDLERASPVVYYAGVDRLTVEANRLDRLRTDVDTKLCHSPFSWSNELPRTRYSRSALTPAPRSLSSCLAP